MRNERLSRMSRALGVQHEAELAGDESASPCARSNNQSLSQNSIRLRSDGPIIEELEEDSGANWYGTSSRTNTNHHGCQSRGQEFEKPRVGAATGHCDSSSSGKKYGEYDTMRRLRGAFQDVLNKGSSDSDLGPMRRLRRVFGDVFEHTHIHLDTPAAGPVRKPTEGHSRPLSPERRISPGRATCHSPKRQQGGFNPRGHNADFLSAYCQKIHQGRGLKCGEGCQNNTPSTAAGNDHLSSSRRLETPRSRSRGLTSIFQKTPEPSSRATRTRMEEPWGKTPVARFASDLVGHVASDHDELSPPPVARASKELNQVDEEELAMFADAAAGEILMKWVPELVRTRRRLRLRTMPKFQPICDVDMSPSEGDSSKVFSPPETAAVRNRHVDWSSRARGKCGGDECTQQ